MSTMQAATQTVEIADVQTQLDRLVQGVARGHDHVLVAQSGTPVAAIVPIKDLEELIRFREREVRWDAEERAAIDEVRRRNADKDPDQVLADVTEVVEEVRREMWEREQRRVARRR